MNSKSIYSLSAGVRKNSYPIAVSNCCTFTLLFTSARFLIGERTDAVALLTISSYKESNYIIKSANTKIHRKV